MGFGGIGPGSLIVILVIVILLFGTKKLRNVGSDLGGALRNFKNSMKSEEGSDAIASPDEKDEKDSGRVIEGNSSKDKENV